MIFADDFDLEFELDSALALGGFLDVADEVENLSRGRVPFIDDEIPVHERHRRFAHSSALELKFIHQPSGLMGQWVFEDATRAGSDGL